MERGVTQPKLVDNDSNQTEGEDGEVPVIASRLERSKGTGEAIPL